jgi:GPN-loop GTPase
MFLRAGGREVCVVNLDPAANHLPYACDVDLCDLVSVEQVQAQLGLGPNGGLAYCFDYLGKNLDWLKVRRV